MSQPVYLPQYPFNKNEVKQKNCKSQAMGLKNKMCGQAFEDRITMACKEYQRNKIAFIEKTPEPFHIIKRIYKNGTLAGFLGFFEKQSQPDFKGTLAGGKAICFEAKTTTKEKIHKNVVSEEQERDLSLQQSFGAEAFVLVSMNLREFFKVPWTEWLTMKEKYGREYMTRDELLPYQVFVNRNGFIEFLRGEKTK